MKIAYILYEGLTILDFIGVYDPVSRLRTMGFIPDLAWDLCAYSDNVVDSSGLGIMPIRKTNTLAGYDFCLLYTSPSPRD